MSDWIWLDLQAWRHVTEKYDVEHSSGYGKGITILHSNAQLRMSGLQTWRRFTEKSDVELLSGNGKSAMSNL